MKNIVIIATGGTIAGSGIASSYKTGQIDVNEILATIPRINELASIRLIDFCQKDSNDIAEKDWLGLRSLCYALGCDKEVDGIVITHGTDSFEETAYFLNLTLDIDKPVVMTGAMRPATATSADGPMNLYEAVALACRPKAKDAGVLAVFADTIYSGRDITKTNSLKTNAFDMGDVGILGYMRDDKVYMQNLPYRLHTYQSEFARAEFDVLPEVGIYYVHTDCDPQLLAWMLDRYDGVVIAGSGSGNYPKAIQEVIENYEGRAKIVRASRLLEGSVFESDVFDPLHKTIPAYRLSPHKARILLMLALAQGYEQADLDRVFELY